MEEHTNMPNVNETGEQPKRRAVTAESMAAKQRDISVSEFFAKNRHLLGFDNPRKALLTTIKEAVDNSLDACEEAGILPEIWVHVEQTGTNRYKVGVQDNGPGILNGGGEGVDIEPGEPGKKYVQKHGIEWIERPHGTRVTIQLEGKFIR